MKKVHLLIVFSCLLLTAVIPLAFAQNGLLCQYRALPCPVGDIPVMHMSASEGHAGDALSATGNTGAICCRGTARGVSTSCTEGAHILDIHQANNAHVEIVGGGGSYSTGICISQPDTNPLAGAVTCRHTTDTCLSNETCVASYHANTNSHVAQCGTYPTNICCNSICTETSEVSCSDTIDNDCDGLIDCLDPDCQGDIQGNVHDQNNNDVSGAQVSVINGSEVAYQELTDGAGFYDFPAIECGTYNMVAAASGFVSSTVSNVVVTPLTSQIVNFVGPTALRDGDVCEADCTFAGDNTVHAECDGRAGCSFYDFTARTVCDLAQPGWTRQYDDDHTIVCAEGSPVLSTVLDAVVECAEENLVKFTKIVNYRGKPVRMVVVTCG